LLEPRRTLFVVERAVEAADGVMMRSGAAMRDGRGRTRRQHIHGLLEQIALVADATEGQVGAPTIRIDMGEATGHGAVAAGDTLQRVARDSRDLAVEIAEAIPRHRGLEGRRQNA